MCGEKCISDQMISEYVFKIQEMFCIKWVYFSLRFVIDCNNYAEKHRDRFGDYLNLNLWKMNFLQTDRYCHFLNQKAYIIKVNKIVNMQLSSLQVIRENNVNVTRCFIKIFSNFRKSFSPKEHNETSHKMPSKYD